MLCTTQKFVHTFIDHGGLDSILHITHIKLSTPLALTLNCIITPNEYCFDAIEYIYLRDPDVLPILTTKVLHLVKTGSDETDKYSTSLLSHLICQRAFREEFNKQNGIILLCEKIDQYIEEDDSVRYSKSLASVLYAIYAYCAMELVNILAHYSEFKSIYIPRNTPSYKSVELQSVIVSECRKALRGKCIL